MCEHGRTSGNSGLSLKMSTSPLGPSVLNFFKQIGQSESRGSSSLSRRRGKRYKNEIESGIGMAPGALLGVRRAMPASSHSDGGAFAIEAGAAGSPDISVSSAALLDISILSTLLL